jgi:hypothetical protein
VQPPNDEIINYDAELEVVSTLSSSRYCGGAVWRAAGRAAGCGGVGFMVRGRITAGLPAPSLKEF